VFYAGDVQIILLVAGAAVVAAVVVLYRLDVTYAPIYVAAGIALWLLVYESGVHATIAGVALGLAMAQQPALRTRHALEPWVNGVVLPLFAFSAALVVIPSVSPSQLAPAFWGVLIALPVGKVIGITLFGWVSLRVGNRGATPHLSFLDLLAAGVTVSLLLSELAFASDPLLRDEATLGVLGGSLISLVVAGALVAQRARHHRRRSDESAPPETTSTPTGGQLA
jgi:NhaA family Na+:H+ antiporter